MIRSWYLSKGFKLDKPTTDLDTLKLCIEKKTRTIWLLWTTLEVPGYFAINLASRCQAEHQEAMKVCAGDTAKVPGFSAIDLASRCQAEHQEAMKARAGDTAKVNIKMQYTKHAIKECYQGRHHQGYFAINLASRCQAEHQEATKACA